MNIQFTGRHITITEAMKEYTLDQIDCFQKYSQKIFKIHVVMEVQRELHQCEINLEGKNLHLNARAKSKNMYESISKCADKIDHQLRNNKHSYHDKNHRKSTKAFEHDILLDQELEAQEVI